MYPQTNPNTPASGGVYIPYFYQWGLYLQTAHTVPTTPKRPEDSAPAVYDFSSDLVAPRRHYHHAQTVEQIIERGYFAVPRGDPTTALISDRKATAWLGLDDLIGQIRNRYEIYESNLYEMKLAQCAAANSLHGIVADRGSAPATPREVYAVQKQLQEIYQEEREERVNLWRDVSRLRVTIAEVAQQYLSAYRKVYFLEASKGDAP